ncbi:MAG: hypothetical protein K0B01_06735 [Syntrophobacterales bacterium]|nr:hypothetical protein [Syntrophobacterales bacterium]
MLPTSIESWLLIAAACLAGFVIGQWIKGLRKRAAKKDEYLDGLKRMALAAEERSQTKKEKKKKRRANKQNGE